MPELTDVVRRVDQRFYGDPLHVDGYQLQPEARLTGWAGGMDAPGGGGGGARLKLTPTALHVRDRDGSETTVPISDPQSAVLRGMAVPAAIVAGLSVVLMFVARRWRAR